MWALSSILVSSYDDGSFDFSIRVYALRLYIDKHYLSYHNINIPQTICFPYFLPHKAFLRRIRFKFRSIDIQDISLNLIFSDKDSIDINKVGFKLSLIKYWKVMCEGRISWANHINRISHRHAYSMSLIFRIWIIYTKKTILSWMRSS